MQLRSPSLGCCLLLSASFACASRRAVAVASTSSRAAFLFSTMTISGDGGQAPAAKRVRTALDELNTSGAFVRVESGFRGWVKEGGPFPPEKGRYILYVSYACPWAHRTLIVRALKGLEDAIDICVVHPTWAKTRPDDNDDNHTGWVFASSKDEPITPLAGKGSISCEGCIPDERYGFRFVRDIYEKAKDTTGKYSVPVLWDTQTETIVNNESSEICTMLNSAFDKFAANPQCDLEPSDLQQAQADVNAWIYTGINNGVYRAGFAQSQAAYDQAVGDVYDALDKAEDILSKQRYLTGSRFTLADIRLFVTLLRFDEVYVVYFKCNKRRICDYPNLQNYIREIYQMEGVVSTVNMHHIKSHYYTSHPTLNTHAVVPLGPGVENDLKKPHNREQV